MAQALRSFSEGVAKHAKASVKKPVAVYIEKVYEEGNFSGLGIGM